MAALVAGRSRSPEALRGSLEFFPEISSLNAGKALIPGFLFFR
jgi:hypothetical protein